MDKINLVGEMLCKNLWMWRNTCKKYEKVLTKIHGFQ